MKNILYVLSLTLPFSASAEMFFPAAEKPKSEAVSSQESTAPSTVVEMQARVRRFAFGPEIGGALFLSDVKGFDMKPAFHLGLRSSYDLVKEFLAVGLMLSAEFVHFSDDKDDGNLASFDISTLSEAFFLEFKPVGGLHFGPYFGLSQKAYAYRKGGFLSHRDEKGTDNFLLSGGFVGYSFKLGRRFHLGPRIDVINYSSLGGSYVNSHTVGSFVASAKWTF